MSEQDADALAVMGTFLGTENVETSREYLRSLDPDLEEHIIDFVYGRIYSGTGLDPKTRALVTVAMLGALDQQVQLSVYIRSALRLGATEEEVRDVLRQVAVYAGFPVSWNCLATAKKIFDAAPGDH